ATLQYSLDGGALQLYQSTFTIAVGSHTLAAQGVDHIGNQRTIAPFTVIVGTTAPVSGAPSGGTLPDGTPVIVSPDPISVVPPLGGGSGGTGSAPPIVKQITITPAPPLGRGTVTFTIKFSKPMDNTAFPSVTFTPAGGGAPISLIPTSYTGD